MIIGLYFDEDSMQHALVEALRVRGVDVVTALEVGMLERPDEEQIRFAASDRRVLYSFNVGDFCRLHGDFLAHSKPHAGIILARQQQYSIGEQMRRLLKLIANRTAESMKNRVEFLSRWA